MFLRGMIDSPSCAGAYGRDGARPSRGAGRVVPRHDPMWYGRENDVMVRLDAVTPQVTPQVELGYDTQLNRLVKAIGTGELSAVEICAGLGLADRKHVREEFLNPAHRCGYIEYTIPDKPHSRLQKYRLTAKGKELLAQLLNESEEKKS